MRKPTKREITAAIACTIEHFQRPDISYDEYRSLAFQGLEVLLADRRIIYLDTKYWVWFRDPSLAKQHEVAVRRLLDRLRDGVSKGRLICPVSFPTIAELYKQPNDLRQATALIMDELSLGVSLKAPKEVDVAELTQLFRQLGNFPGPSNSEPVWTKVGLLFGERSVTTALAEAPDLAGQKRAFNSLWTLPVSELSSFASQMTGLPDFGYRINQERAGKPRGNLNLDQLSFIGLYTDLDQKRESIIQALSEVASGGLKSMAPPPETTWEPFLREMCMASRKAPSGQRLPYQRTIAAVHASIRMNDAGLHETNDLADGMHAAGALT
jgi:hypothetical protein